MSDNKISVFKMVSFLICGIIVLDTFVAPAVLGISSITLWVLVAVLFTIPNAFINAELGAAYPKEGGIYNWIQDSMGEGHATIAGWFYWVNVGFWMPAVFIAFTTWFSYTFAPEMGTIPSMLLTLAVCWVIVGIVRRGMDLGVAAANLAAIIKVVVLVAFGLLGVIYAIVHGPANDFGNVANWIPNFSDLSTMSFVTTIVFNLLGFELLASLVTDMKDPKKDVPKATFLGVIVIAGLYIFGTFGVLVATPADSIDPLDGFYNALMELTSICGPAQGFVFKTIMIGTLYTLIAQMISWVIGASEVLAVVDFAKHIKVLSKRHPKYGTLAGSYVVLGVLASVQIILNYLLAGDANEAFWNVLAFSIVIFIFPYIYIGPAAIILRKRDGLKDRSFVTPGGTVGLWIAGVLNFVFVALSIILLFFTGEWDPVYHLTLIIGTTLTTLVGFIFHWISKSKMLRSP